MKLLTLLLLFSLTFTSCSKKAGKTSTDFGFVLGGISSLTNADGGAMLWGKHQTGASFSINLNLVSGDLALDLKNGAWDFYTVAWDNSSTGGVPLTGVVRCATQKGVLLEGGETTVDLSLSNETCATSDYTDGTNLSGTHSFPEINLSSCRDIGPIASTLPCEYTAGTYTRGFLNSYQVILSEHIQGDVGGIIPLNGPAGRLESECIATDAGSSFYSHLITPTFYPNIPLGNGNAPFQTVIKGYFDSSCDGHRGVVEDVYGLGIYHPNMNSGGVINGNLRVQSDYAGQKFIMLHHETPVPVSCALSHAPPTEMRLGLGTVDSPYAICAPEDFNKISTVSGALIQNFEQVKDIDFGGYSAGLNDPLGIPACVDLGTSVVPVGGLYTDMVGCSGDTQIRNSYTPFSGTYDGKGLSAKNVFIFEEEYEQIGLFRKIGTPGIVKNLTIKNADIEAKAYVGALVGEVDGALELANIFVKESFIDSKHDGSNQAFTGGVAGYINNATNLDSLHVIRSEVEGNGNFIGGVTGKLASSDLSESSFAGRITVYSDSGGPSLFVGGITGYLSGSGTETISQSRSLGSISGKIKQVGGIAGFTDQGKVHDSYSEMAISSSESSTGLNIGGIVGETATSGEIAKAYFTGQISHMCTSGTPCKVGMLVGLDSVSNNNNTFTVNFITTDGGVNGAVESWASLKAAKPASLITVWTNNSNLTPPKLIWESALDDPCMDPQNLAPVVTQVGGGRGASQTNPVIICNHDQFAAIKSYKTKHFKLDNIINLAHQNPFTDYIVDTNFTGSINGNDLLVHGAQMNSLARGIFEILKPSALIENLHISNISINSSNNIIGTLAKVNEGTIRNVSVSDSSITTGGNMIGGIVGQNSPGGLIEDVLYNWGIQLDATNTIGGIAGKNEGTIRRAIANAHISPTGTVYDVGGAVGLNIGSGVVDQVESNSSINISVNGSSKIGGVIGNNQSTAVNLNFAEHGKIDITSATAATQVGGVIGRNSGSIHKSLSVGRIQLSDMSYTNEVGGLVGKKVSGTIGPNNFYANSPFTIAGSVGNTVTAILSSAINCDVQGSTLTIANNDYVLFEGSNELYIISNVTSGDYRIAAINSDPIACNNLLNKNFTEIVVGKVNLLNTWGGTYTPGFELKKISTYCSSATTGGDPNFRCPAGTEWDIIEDDKSGTGSNYLKAFFKSEIYNQSPPTNLPIWDIEEDKDYPDFVFDW